MTDSDILVCSCLAHKAIGSEVITIRDIPSSNENIQEVVDTARHSILCAFFFAVSLFVVTTMR